MIRTGTNFSKRCGTDEGSRVFATMLTAMVAASARVRAREADPFTDTSLEGLDILAR